MYLVTMYYVSDTVDPLPDRGRAPWSRKQNTASENIDRFGKKRKKTERDFVHNSERKLSFLLQLLLKVTGDMTLGLAKTGMVGERPGLG